MKDMKKVLVIMAAFALMFLGAACGDSGNDCNYYYNDNDIECVDSDGDGYGLYCEMGADCDDSDVNNWISCDTCLDSDTDTFFSGCDAYVTIQGEDCDDADPNNWVSCATCLDGDSDTYYAGCDAYVSIQGEDCDDYDYYVYPGAPEICDGVDNQCPGDPGYGTVDEGCCSWVNKIGSDVRITNDTADSLYPSLAWTGTEYGVSWHDERDGNIEIYFARISASGEKIGPDVRITNAAGWSYFPSLAWTGTEFGVTWYDARDGNNEIYFARISATGEKIGSDVRITNAAEHSRYPSLAWTGSEYGVSWYDYRDGNDEIYFARISASGDKIGSDIRITNDAWSSYHPSLAWTGTEYGVSWQDYRDGSPEIYFARISASGEKIGSDVRITNDASYSKYPSLAWTGTGYGVSWEDNRDGNWEIYFARISATGNKTGPDVRITNAPDSSNSTSLAWTGAEYWVSWHDNREGNYEIYFARISATGEKIGEDVRITNAAGYSYHPSTAWTGTEFGVSWYDDRDGNYEIYFARIGCQ